MENKNILDIGSIIADINQGAASKFGQFFVEKTSNQGGKGASKEQKDEDEDREPIGVYDTTYKELCDLLNNIKQKWGTEDAEGNWFNKYYQRDLLYLYDRISLDIDYLNGYPDRNKKWLEKLLELKFEIRNLF